MCVCDANTNTFPVTAGSRAEICFKTDRDPDPSRHSEKDGCAVVADGLSTEGLPRFRSTSGMRTLSRSVEVWKLLQPPAVSSHSFPASRS